MVFVHCVPAPRLLVGGQLAVQLFYAISGFVISHVLLTTPKYRDPATFYRSRALRLYPVYFVVAALALLVRIILSGQWLLQFYRAIPFGAALLLIVSNVILFGQDWVMFSAVQHGALVFSKDFRDSQFLLYEGLLVPQAWTLGVELTFYLIAPFVLRDVRKIVGLLLASLILRAFLVWNGIGLRDPWTYRFFPTELALFLLGALSQQVLLPKWKRFIDNAKNWRAESIGTGFLLACCAAYPFLPGSELVKGMTLIGCFIILLPLPFLYQSKSELDRKIGELSYPIYIGHVLVITVIGSVAFKMKIAAGGLITVGNVIGSIIFAAALNHFVASKVEVYRKALGSHGFTAPLPQHRPEKTETPLGIDET